LATPLGITANETWTALVAGRGICNHAATPLPASPTMERVAQLALHVSREAIAQSGWTDGHLSDPATALIVGTSKGPIESWLNDKSDRSHLVRGIGDTAARIAESLRIGNGPRFTVSAACASSLIALIQAAMLLQNGIADRALVIGVESSLHPLFQGCFQRLGVLAKPGSLCRPFDQNRTGFHLSEAAAAVCLELSNEPSPLFIDNFAVGGAGGHLTSGDPTGATLKHLLRRVLSGKPIDLIHAHGTGTLANDAMELAAIDVCLGDHPETPILYSHKAALGHSLGASGLVSIVLNCLMHQHEMVLPNINTPDPLPVQPVRINPHPLRLSIRRSIAIASGFGGSTAAVSLAR
jgi:3-oxoacyl-[acyl-carrier-protein] synthase II